MVLLTWTSPGSGRADDTTSFVTLVSFVALRSRCTGRSLCPSSPHSVLKQTFHQLRQNLRARQQPPSLAVVDARDFVGGILCRVGGRIGLFFNSIPEMVVLDCRQHHAIGHVAMGATVEMPPQDFRARGFRNFYNSYAAGSRLGDIIHERNIKICAGSANDDLPAVIPNLEGFAGCYREVLH